MLIFQGVISKDFGPGLPFEPVGARKLLQVRHQKQKVHEAHQIGIIILATQGLNGLLQANGATKCWTILENRVKKQGIVGNGFYQFI